MKLAISITATVPDEAGTDSVLAATYALAKGLKDNGVIEVQEVAVVVED